MRAVALGERVERDLYREGTAVPALRMQLALAAHRTRRRPRRIGAAQRRVRFALGARDQAIDGLAEQFSRCVAEHPLGTAVGEDDTAVAVHHQRTDGRVFDELAKTPLVAFEFSGALIDLARHLLERAAEVHHLGAAATGRRQLSAAGEAGNRARHPLERTHHRACQEHADDDREQQDDGRAARDCAGEAAGAADQGRAVGFLHDHERRAGTHVGARDRDVTQCTGGIASRGPPVRGGTDRGLCAVATGAAERRRGLVEA